MLRMSALRVRLRLTPSLSMTQCPAEPHLPPVILEGALVRPKDLRRSEKKRLFMHPLRFFGRVNPPSRMTAGLELTSNSFANRIGDLLP